MYVTSLWNCLQNFYECFGFIEDVSQNRTLDHVWAQSTTSNRLFMNKSPLGGNRR